ncbi:MAG: hypothetical protein J5804_00255, partial [Eggerthellaceae bacterium]|nr:hypothetical protein [Eggerthellaceae bacterium]
AAFCGTCGAQVASVVSETNASEAADRVDARIGLTKKGAMFQLRAAIDEIRSDGGSEDVPVQDEPIPVKGYGKTLAILSGLAAVVVAAAAVYFAMYAPYSIDERVFPDAAVCELLSSQADTDGDGKLSRDEANALETLDLSGTGATSLEGVEHLKGLKSLNVSGMPLTSLDVSAFGNLEELDASGCEQLATLDLGEATNLKRLDVTSTQIDTLDVSAQSELQELAAAGTPLASLDVSANPQLEALSVEDGVFVTGIDATQLRAQYQPLTYRRLGTDGLGTQQYFDSLTSFSYDDQNRLVQILSSNADHETGELIGNPTTETFEYDDQGRCVKDVWAGEYGHEANIVYDDEGRLVGTESNAGAVQVNYDTEGRLARVAGGSGYSSEYTGGVAYTAYAYDDQGRVSSSETPVSDSRTTGYMYHYDGKGNLISIEYHDKTNVFVTTEEFEYDEQGRCVKLRTRGPYGALNDSFYEYSFSYDERGNAITAEDLELSYDEDGNLISRRFLGDEVGEGSTEITYRRVFTAKDAPDLFQPVQIGNPYAVSRIIYPYTINLSASDDPVAASFGPYPLG